MVLLGPRTRRTNLRLAWELIYKLYVLTLVLLSYESFSRNLGGFYTGEWESGIVYMRLLGHLISVVVELMLRPTLPKSWERDCGVYLTSWWLLKTWTTRWWIDCKSLIKILCLTLKPSTCQHLRVNFKLLCKCWLVYSLCESSLLLHLVSRAYCLFCLCF